jgi:hypothetical protein
MVYQRGKEQCSVKPQLMERYWSLTPTSCGNSKPLLEGNWGFRGFLHGVSPYMELT